MPKRVNCVAQLQDGSVGIIQALAVFDGSPTQLHLLYLVFTEKLQLVKNVPFMDAQLGVRACFGCRRSAFFVKIYKRHDGIRCGSVF